MRCGLTGVWFAAHRATPRRRHISFLKSFGECQLHHERQLRCFRHASVSRYDPWQGASFDPLRYFLTHKRRASIRRAGLDIDVWNWCWYVQESFRRAKCIWCRNPLPLGRRRRQLRRGPSCQGKLVLVRFWLMVAAVGRHYQFELMGVCHVQVAQCYVPYLSAIQLFDQDSRWQAVRR